jgi:hypothetical protein
MPTILKVYLKAHATMLHLMFSSSCVPWFETNQWCMIKKASKVGFETHDLSVVSHVWLD